MCDHAETFHANNGYKLASAVIILISPLSEQKFQILFVQKRGLAHAYVLYENESLKHCLSYDLIPMATFLFLEVQFFQRIGFLGSLYFSGSRSWSRSMSTFQTILFQTTSFSAITVSYTVRNVKPRCNEALTYFCHHGNSYGVKVALVIRLIVKSRFI